MKTFDQEDATKELTEFFRASMREHMDRVSGIPTPFVVQVDQQMFDTNAIEAPAQNRVTKELDQPALGIPQPGIDAMYPNHGTYLGGTTVTIVGRDFAVGMEVKIDGVPLIGVNIISDTTIYGVMPAHAPGTYDLTVGLPATEPFLLQDAYRYTRVVIDSIDPTHGSVGGSTNVTLFGAGFVEGAQVKWDNVNSIGGTFVSSTVLTALSPPHVAGVTDISVTNPDGENGLLADAYTYDASSGIDHFDYIPLVVDNGVVTDMTLTALDASNNILSGYTGPATVIIIQQENCTVGTVPPLGQPITFVAGVAHFLLQAISPSGGFFQLRFTDTTTGISSDSFNFTI